MMQTSSQNSTNKDLFLQKMTYPKDNFESYYITAQEVYDCLNEGKTPQISIAGLEPKGAKIAVILAVEKHPEREEVDYYVPCFYADAIIKAGGYPVFVGFDKTLEQLEALAPKACMLIGGDFKFPENWAEESLAHHGSLRREQAYEAVVNYARQKRLPLLGICAGEQVLAGMFGAKLARAEGHRCSLDAACHKINIAPDTLLFAINGTPEAEVNSNHFDVVSAQNLGDCVVSATASDGIVEAIELKHPWHYFVLGVQWHPERFVARENTLSLKLFDAFVKAARGFVLIDEKAMPFKEANLVEITDPHFIVDMMYARKDNICGEDVYNNVGLGNRAFVQKELWERLQKLIPWLEANKRKLKVFDAYRPPVAHMAFKKAIHEDGPGLFASRPVISKHCHASAIDVALTNLDGVELAYPTKVDCYTPEYATQIQSGQTEAFYDYAKQGRHDYQNPNMTAEIANREQLCRLMESVGMQAYVSEWWHYEMPDEFNFIFPMIEW